MTYEFKRPNRGNVKLGDILVVESQGQMRTPIICIVHTDRVSATTADGNFTAGAFYKDAVILRQDGGYLIRECASRDAEAAMREVALPEPHM
ncbi:MAG: hypothetical protein KKF56_01700 [Nanoarchaeota archaeon]|nr:hypothetical protein [Nanoarchaeota archaeon]